MFSPLSNVLQISRYICCNRKEILILHFSQILEISHMTCPEGKQGIENPIQVEIYLVRFLENCFNNGDE